jgi:hypothetical protein
MWRRPRFPSCFLGRGIQYIATKAISSRTRQPVRWLMTSCSLVFWSEWLELGATRLGSWVNEFGRTFHRLPRSVLCYFTPAPIGPGPPPCHQGADLGTL